MEAIGDGLIQGDVENCTGRSEVRLQKLNQETGHRTRNPNTPVAPPPPQPRPLHVSKIRRQIAIHWGVTLSI